MVRSLAVVAVVLLSAACSKTPTAAEACGKLEAAGIAKGCHEVKLEGLLNGRGRTKYDFELVSAPGQKGAVMDFEKDDDFEATVKGYEAAAALAGPHRYGSAKARIFVQLNTAVSLEDGKKAKAIVEGL